MARSLTLLLKQAGFQVTSCGLAETALNEIVAATSSRAGTDLLIIDVPESDCEGKRLLKQLQERDITLPLIIITPYGSEGIIAELRKGNSPLFLCTPFEPADLLSCIEQVSRDPNCQ